MSGRQLVEQWLFEYACRHRLIRVIAEIAQRHHNVWSVGHCTIPSIYVLLAFVKEVIEKQRVSQYEMVISELTRLYEVSSNCVPFNVYARLLVALKASVLFEMLRKSNRLVLPRLNAYFPRSGFHHESADEDFAEHLNAGQQQFRACFLRLITDKQQRAQYFRDQYELEYGTHFIDKTKQLSQRIIDSIDGSLPPCAIDRLLGENADQELATELSLPCSPSFELLLDAVNGHDCFTEFEVINLLRSLRSCSDVAPPTSGLSIMASITRGGDETNRNPVFLHDSSIAAAAHSCTAPSVIVNRNLMHCSGPSAAKRPRISEVDIFCASPQNNSIPKPIQLSVEPSRRCPSVDSLADFDARYSQQPATSHCSIDALSSRFTAEMINEITEDEFGSRTHKTAVSSKLSGELSDNSGSSRRSESVDEQISLHMKEFLKFIEKAPTIDVSMAQVHTVSSTVSDIDFSASNQDIGSVTFVSMSPLESECFTQKSCVETSGRRVIPDSPVLAYTASRKSPSDLTPCDAVSAEVVSCYTDTLIGSEESFINDSDLQSRPDMPELHLVPSSYSFDQYDVMLSDMPRGVAPIPIIENHLRPAAVQRSCVVKLVRDEEHGCWC